MTNNSTYHDYEFTGVPLHPYVKWGLVGLCGVALVVGCCGNTVIIATILSQKLSKNIHNIFIINLATLDTGLLLVFMPNSLYTLINGRSASSSHTMCNFLGFATMSCACTSLNTIMAISVNRYLKILHFQLYQKLFTNSRTIMVCILIWVYTSVLATLPLLGWGRYAFDRKEHICFYDRKASLSYTIFLLSNNLFLPTTAVLFCNYKIYKFVMESKKRVSSQKASASDIKLMKTFFVTFIVLMVLYTPYTLLSLVDRHDYVDAEFYAVTVHLTSVNYSINFFVYSFINVRFRQSCLKLFRKTKNQVQDEPSTQMSQVSASK